MATNDNGKGVSSAQGPATQWRATGKPASWGAWSVLPTGSNNQARASFTVPPSRGAESLVRIYVDGTKVQQVATTGKTDQLFDVPNNLTSHSVMLEVCNEELACSQSAAQSVQTYGPLVTGHIHSITPTIDVTRISWTIEVDSNGDEATLTVTSDRGRNETFTVPVGVSTFTTQAIAARLPADRERHGHAVGRLPGPRAGLGHQLRHDRAARRRRRVVGVEGCRLQRRPGSRSAAV